MLISILIDDQYLQKVVFNFEKGSNSQNHASSGSHHPIKKYHQQNFQSLSPHYSLTLFGKHCKLILNATHPGWAMKKIFTLDRLKQP